MDTRTLLTKCITLIYRESQLEDTSYDNEHLIRTIVDTVKTEGANDVAFSGHNKLKELKEYILELLSDKTKEFQKEVMLQRLKLLLETDTKLYEAVEQGIAPDYEQAVNKRVIINLVKALNTHFREHKLGEALNKASYQWTFQRPKITDVKTFFDNLIAEVEPLLVSNNSKDPAIVDEIDLTDEEGVVSVFNEMKKTADGTAILRLGFRGVNEGTQGGLRRDQYAQVTALPSNYKTGFSLTCFAQIALFNNPEPPKLNEQGTAKRPLLLRIAFEDSSKNNFQFLYQYLKLEEGIKISQEDLKTVDEKEAAVYVKRRLSATGFHIKMLRVNPIEWTYKDICNKVIAYEAMGYEVYFCVLDYLSMVPTTGCNTSGAMGTDRRDQIRRVRNFFVNRGIGVLSPHQMSNDAKDKLRLGTPHVALLKEVANKGFYEGSKQLDQELDLDMYIHLVPHQGETYLAWMRGKHRLPTNVPESKKFCLLKFKDGEAPLVSDLHEETPILRSLPKHTTFMSEDTFGLL